MFAVVVVALLLDLQLQSTSALDAQDIPRVNTPSPGDWPQSNITGCGFTGLPYTNVLANCTEEIDPSAPDITGYWKNTATNETDELIEQCGSRWIDTSKSVIHDFPQCTGVVGDGLGCQDYSGPKIIEEDMLCSPIVTGCKFEEDEDGNKCVNLYTTNPATNTVTKVVSRCLQQDGKMIWVHPLAGTVIYEKVDVKDEPNCMKCMGGEFDGVTAYNSEDELPCSYEEREWMRCSEEDMMTSSSSPSATPTTTANSSGNLKFHLSTTILSALFIGVVYATLTW